MHESTSTGGSPPERVGHEPIRSVLLAALRVADRLDALAETAELMDDLDGAARLRDQAACRRLEAMRTLDD